MPEITSTPTTSDQVVSNGAVRLVPTAISHDTEHVREHLDFLDRMAAEGVVPQRLAERAHEVWARARQKSGNRLPVPAATAGEGGPVGLNWDRGEHHLEAEIPSDGPVEWFYRNWITDEIWDVDQPLGEPFPPILIQYFERIVIANES